VPVADRKRPVMGGVFAAKIDELVERSEMSWVRRSLGL